MTLLIIGVSEIGRKSVSIDVGVATFGIGDTTADFQISGSFLCLIDELNRKVTGPASSCEKDLNNHAGN